MEIVKKRRPGDVARGFFQLCHPIPVLFHTIGVTVFALLAAWPKFVWITIVFVVAAHTAMQLSISVLNDYCDRRLDAMSKRNKPIPQGLVTPREALVTGLLLVVLMLLFLLPLNPLALLISLLYLALGQGYNLGLKSTPLSGVVFALAIPLIPIYAFVGVGHIISLLFWLFPVAALLGISLNLANSLPDVEQDAMNGARTLAVVLGIRGTFLTSRLLISLAIALIGILTLTHLVVVNTWVVYPILIVSILAMVIMLLFFGPEKSIQTRKTYFYVVVLTCLLLVGGWIIGGIA